MNLKLRTCFLVIVSAIIVGFNYRSVLAYQVTVHIINKSAPEKKIEGIPLTLYLLEQKGRNLEVNKELKGKTNSEGIYNLTLDEGEKGMYLGAETIFRGTPYSTPLQTIVGKEKYKLILPVYEISDNNKPVSIKERKVFVRSIKDGEISLSELITISNTGNKTYVGRYNDKEDLHEVIRLGMPGGYELFSINRVDRREIIYRGNAIIINERVKPGEKTFFISYGLRTDIGVFRLHFPVATPYQRFLLLIPLDIDWKVKTIRLEEKGKVALGGVDYLQWEGADLKKGAEVIVNLTNPEKGGVIGINELSIAGGLLIGIAIAVIYLKQAKQSPSLDDEKEYLLDIVKDLDEETKEMETAKEIYAPYRETLLKRVREIEGILSV